MLIYLLTGSFKHLEHVDLQTAMIAKDLNAATLQRCNAATPKAIIFWTLVCSAYLPSAPQKITSFIHNQCLICSIVVDGLS